MTNENPHFLFLFSDTGGGHRSAVDAIIEAMQLEYPDGFSAEKVDFFKQYAPPPLNFAPELYPMMSKKPDPLGNELSSQRRETSGSPGHAGRHPLLLHSRPQNAE